MIAAEGEQKASKSLAEASKVMSETGAALQLRYLQVGTMITAQWISSQLGVDLSEEYKAENKHFFFSWKRSK